MFPLKISKHETFSLILISWFLAGTLVIHLVMHCGGLASVMLITDCSLLLWTSGFTGISLTCLFILVALSLLNKTQKYTVYAVVETWQVWGCFLSTVCSTVVSYLLLLPFLFIVNPAGVAVLDFEVHLCASPVLCCLTNSIQQQWRLCLLLCSLSKELFMINSGFNVCFTTSTPQLWHGGGGLMLRVCVLAVLEDFYSLQIVLSNRLCRSLILSLIIFYVWSTDGINYIASGYSIKPLCLFRGVCAISR